MPVFLFACACGWQGDRLVDAHQATDDCPACGGEAEKRFSPPIIRVLLVAGTEGMTPGEITLALENKASIEAQADRIHDGSIRVKTRSTVPLELRPQIPKKFH